MDVIRMSFLLIMSMPVNARLHQGVPPNCHGFNQRVCGASLLSRLHHKGPPGARDLRLSLEQGVLARAPHGEERRQLLHGVTRRDRDVPQRHRDAAT